ncbi:hypothetical protein AMJ40_02820 [candidate division TA06 bacterium DG_26]|uniref:Isochorismatase-like domain-containing protein n=1 Tax=candidate division TA06 bacterium DG_26 TaxID=1703771 RepID=A0A0S7WK60_UNCT6|nr:MAG: hypothetical protein AMJ40_02820 [candidate division TA06 bacterium DG_26]
MECYVTKEDLTAKCARWLEHINSYNVHRMELNVPKCVLLVIDMQNFFLQPKSPAFLCAGLAILPRLKRFIQVSRKAKIPIVYTSHAHHPDRIDAGILEWWWSEMCIEGTEESRIHAEVAPRAHEKVISKHRYSAFYNTDLETILRCCGTEDVIVSGVMTNICCESTTRDAYFRDYRVFFLADGTASSTEEMHCASLLNLAYGFAYITTIEQLTQQVRACPERKERGRG